MVAINRNEKPPTVKKWIPVPIEYLDTEQEFYYLCVQNDQETYLCNESGAILIYRSMEQAIVGVHQTGIESCQIVKFPSVLLNEIRKTCPCHFVTEEEI